MFDAVLTTSGKTVSEATTGSLLGLGAGATLAALSANKIQSHLGGPLQLALVGAGVWAAGRYLGGDPLKTKSDQNVSDISTIDWAMAVLPAGIGAGLLCVGLYRWVRG